MSRLWITARPAFAPSVLEMRRTTVRKAYRRLRRAGLDKHQARWVVEDVLSSARIEVKP